MRSCNRATTSNTFVRSSEPSPFRSCSTGSVDDLDRLLREKYETAIVPGSYFDMPQHFRVGIGGDPEMTRIAFERLGAGLDEIRRDDVRSSLRRASGEPVIRDLLSLSRATCLYNGEAGRGKSGQRSSPSIVGL